MMRWHEFSIDQNQNCGKKLSIRTPQKIESWLYERALPHWHVHGIDREHGGFTERLTLSGLPGICDFKRIRVQARQIYVFSHASLIDPDPVRQARWREAAAQGFDFMTRHYWQGPARGWAKTVTPSGAVLDSAADSYDQAFVLFAAAWHFRASCAAHALEIVRQTLDFLDQNLACTAYGGYFEGLSGTGEVLRGPPRLQNPHMHLLEALLALYQATDDQTYLERGAQLFELFRTRFFDSNTHSLGEYFSQDWQALGGPQGQIVEPGHHFEWSWILHSYGRLAGEARAHDIAHQAYEFACAHGVNADRNLAYDEIDRNGNVVRASHRLWPQTETLKAHIAAAKYAPDEQAGTRARHRIAPTVDAIFHNYFIPNTGIWNDQLDQHSQPVSQTVPATSLYHLFLAFTEALRFYEANKSI